MSQAAKHKGAEHFIMAAEHLEAAAKHWRDAAKSYEAGNDQKAGHHALAAHGEFVLAQDHEREASRLHAAEFRKP